MSLLSLGNNLINLINLLTSIEEVKAQSNNYRLVVFVCAYVCAHTSELGGCDHTLQLSYYRYVTI